MGRHKKEPEAPITNSSSTPSTSTITSQIDELKNGVPNIPKSDLLIKKLAEKAKLLKEICSFRANDIGTADQIPPVKVYPTGIDILDNYVLGCGGVPQGSFIEISGLESSGKSALSYFIGGAMQSRNPDLTADIYDVEDAFTPSWGQSMGMALDRTRKIPFWGLENLSELVKANLAMENPSEISVIDSLAVLQPQQVMGKTLDELGMNDNMQRAKLLTDFFNSVRDGFWFPQQDAKGDIPKGAKQIKIGYTPCVLICINHVKPHTKMAGGRSYVEYETVGGMSLRYHASIRLTVSRAGFEKTGDKVTHQLVKVKCIKNKYGPPQRECELKLAFSGGLEANEGVNYLELALTKGLVVQKGPMIVSALLPNGKIKGKQAFNELVESTPDLKKLFIN